MGKTNKDRQAAFKQKMRNAGKRQVTLWVDTEHELAVKALIAGKPLVEASQSRDQAAETTLLASWSALLAENEREVDARQHQFDTFEHQLKKREVALSLQIDKASPGHKATRLSNADRAAKLVEWFTTREDWKTGERQAVHDSYNAIDKAAEMVSLSRQTKSAGTTIEGLLVVYGNRHAMLNSTETKVLKDALNVLDGLGQAAGSAKDQVNRAAKRVKAEEEARNRAAAAAIKEAFPVMQMVDSILFLCHMDGNANRFELQEIRRAQPGVKPHIFQGDVKDMQRAAITDAEWRVKQAMLNDGSTALAAASALKASFEAIRAELLAQHGGLVNHAATCMTAAMLQAAK